MKKIYRINIFIFLLIGILLNFGVSQENNEILVDTGFEWGLIVLDPVTGAVQGSIVWQDIDIASFWEMGQWNSQSSAIDIESEILPSSAVVWEDSNKIIKMGTRATEGYDLYLGVNSISEYDSIFRVLGQPWPALLVQQRISPPGNIGPGCEPLSKLSKLRFQVDACLDTVNIIKTAGYNPNIHAAQFLIYFTVQNLGSNPKLFGKYVWLGVQVYDDRYQSPPKYVAHDDGTRMLIYSIAYDETADSTTHSGKWVHFNVDLLPHAKSAVTEAWNKGYFSYEEDGSIVTPPLNFDDYKIGGMNMGWEAPGMFYAAFKVKDLSLKMALATAIEDEYKTIKLNSLQLYKNYPNPFNPQTTISYEISYDDRVKVDIFNINGCLISTLVNDFQSSGIHSVKWNPENQTSGIYIYRVTAGNKIKSGKMILLK